MDSLNKGFTYDNKLYNEYSAWQVLPGLLNKFKIHSIVDVGCGLGTWLSVANKLGIKNYKGLDGSIYNDESFVIPEKNYQQVNLNQAISINKTFDLCLCLEVAEHLPASSADDLVDLLCHLAPIVLFSAAIPGQPGQGHINLQWQDFWQEKFHLKGYEAYDLRNEFWNNNKVEWWYRQNMIIYARPGFLTDLPKCNHPVHRLVHPLLYELKLNAIKDLQEIKNRSVFYPSLSFALKTLAKSILVTPWKKESRIKNEK